MKTKTFFRITLVFLICLVMVSPSLGVAAHGGHYQTPSPPVAVDPAAPLLPPVDSLGTLIQWLIGPGLTVVVGYFMSFLADKMDWWNKVPHDIKVIAPYILAIGMVLLGNLLLKNLPMLLTDKTISLIASSILFYIATQKQHNDYDAKVAALPSGSAAK